MLVRSFVMTRSRGAYQQSFERKVGCRRLPEGASRRRLAFERLIQREA